jgi:excinuclease ABC subunit C
MVRSELDDVPGLGPTRRKALMKVFGSVKKLRAATAEEIAVVPGIGFSTAQSIVESLAGTDEDRTPAVNMMTGEILED